MAPHDFVEAAFQNRRIERRRYAQSIEDVEKRQVRHRLLQRPQPFLGRRRRQRFVAGDARDLRLPCPAGLDQRFEIFRHLGNGRCIEQAYDPDFEMHDIVNAGQNVRGQKRIAAQREEIVMDADPVEAKHLRPDAG